MSAIKIIESHEPLVDIKKHCPKVVISIDKRRLKFEKKFYLRKTVADMINKAITYLPLDTTFIIRDAWRPQYVQKEIFKGFFEHFSKKYPNWTKKEVITEINKYVAASTGKFASGHMTGGAVDLRLIKNGRKIPMNDRQNLTYQENAQSLQPKLKNHLQKNRQLMFDALIKSGLSNYPKEYWHWSYGDIQWAKRNKKPVAIYGVITQQNNPQ